MLRDARAQGRTVALLMCDLDRFKRINDDCGHEAGDREDLVIAITEAQAAWKAAPEPTLVG